MLAKDTGFYNSRAWKTTRHAYKQSVGNLCERCLKRGIIASADVVHHIVPLTEETVKDLNLSLNWDNLQALCSKCHGEVHEEIYARRSGRRYKINPDGSVEIREETPPGPQKNGTSGAPRPGSTKKYMTTAK